MTIIDYNGDGKDDIISLTLSDTFLVDVTDTFQIPTINPDSETHIVTGNFDADASMELAGVDADGNFWIANQVEGEFAVTDQAQFPLNDSAKAVVSGNFDGIGPDEVAVYTQDGRVLIARNTGEGFDIEEWANPGLSGNLWDSFYAGDFNGDGTDDLLGFGNGGAIYVFESDGNSFNESIWASWESAENWHSFHIADFNFDDRDDFIGIGTGGTVWVGLSSDMNTFNRSLWAQLGSTDNWHSFLVGNFDGSHEGNGDLLGIRQDGSWTLASSNGAGFDINAQYGQWQPGAFWHSFYPGNREGDGLNDIIGLAFGSSVWEGLADSEMIANPVEISVNDNVLLQLYVDDFDNDGQDEVAGFTNSNGLWYL